MSAQSDLQTAYENYAGILRQVTATPKPSYSVDGKSYSWTEYQAFIITQMKELKCLIQQEDEPFIVRSRAIT